MPFNLIQILFLAANPRDTEKLRLDEEFRSIDRALRESDFRNKFNVEQQWAVRFNDLQGHILRYKPDIVHFSGHGSVVSKIILEDSSGKSHPVSSRALGQLFRVLKDNIRCVVLNACYSEQQARAIAQHIDCVIGMSNAIGDSAAINFATSFYQALGYGRNVKDAFELGCNQVDLANLDEQDTPKLLCINSDPKDIVFVREIKPKKIVLGQQQNQKIKSAPIKKLTWKKAEEAADKMVRNMNYERFIPSLIVGIGRGGAIMGALISERMAKIPLLAIDRKYVWKGGRKIDDLFLRFKLPSKCLDRVLLVAGEVHTGTTMKLYLDYLSKIGANVVRCATFYLQEGCPERIDYFGEKNSKKILMPWVLTKDAN